MNEGGGGGGVDQAVTNEGEDTGVAGAGRGTDADDPGLDLGHGHLAVSSMADKTVGLVSL